jgi:DNA mismatch repair protein MutS
LADLENSHRDTRQRVRRVMQQPAADNQLQLALFTAGEHPLVASVRELEIENLTPIEALTLLYEFKRQAGTETPTPASGA